MDKPNNSQYVIICLSFAMCFNLIFLQIKRNFIIENSNPLEFYKCIVSCTHCALYVCCEHLIDFSWVIFSRFINRYKNELEISIKMVRKKNVFSLYKICITIRPNFYWNENSLHNFFRVVYKFWATTTIVFNLFKTNKWHWLKPKKKMKINLNVAICEFLILHNLSFCLFIYFFSDTENQNSSRNHIDDQTIHRIQMRFNCIWNIVSGWSSKVRVVCSNLDTCHFGGWAEFTWYMQ